MLTDKPTTENSDPVNSKLGLQKNYLKMNILFQFLFSNYHSMLPSIVCTYNYREKKYTYIYPAYRQINVCLLLVLEMLLNVYEDDLESCKHIDIQLRIYLGQICEIRHVKDQPNKCRRAGSINHS